HQTTSGFKTASRTASHVASTNAETQHSTVRSTHHASSTAPASSAPISSSFASSVPASSAPHSSASVTRGHVCASFSDDVPAGEIDGGEYLYQDLNAPRTDYIYTVANIVSTGVLGGSPTRSIPRVSNTPQRSPTHPLQTNSAVQNPGVTNIATVPPADTFLLSAGHASKSGFRTLTKEQSHTTGRDSIVGVRLLPHTVTLASQRPQTTPKASIVGVRILPHTITRRGLEAPTDGVVPQAAPKHVRDTSVHESPDNVAEKDPLHLRFTANITVLNSRATSLLATESNSLAHRSLQRRGCYLSKFFGIVPQVPAELWCNALIPGVDQCRSQISTYASSPGSGGRPGSVPSVFYTSWPPNKGYGRARKWMRFNIGCDSQWTDWDYMVDRSWRDTTLDAIARPFGREGLGLSVADQNQKTDPFLKNLSQAYAEASAGDAYLFMPDGSGAWSDSSAWGGWEYPALTRNANIRNIYRVNLKDNDDPNAIGDPSAPQVLGEKELIWTQGDAPSSIEPRGTKGLSLPAGIPEGQVPDGWQDQDGPY
ncbi:MAG: hypothetical protein Q9190_006830, partial [Brigantiaea leucoxantha]